GGTKSCCVLGGQWLRQSVLELFQQLRVVCILGIDRWRLGERRTIDRELGLAGNANLAANQPIHFGRERHVWSGRLKIGRDTHGNREEDFVLVAIIHQRTQREALGSRKQD